MEKAKEYLNFVIVGHVDHGKSTLIGRLLYDTNSLPEGLIDEVKKTCDMLGRELEFAFILDSLEEEREQNITIDTTQTFFKTKKRDYVIIDAPGHKEFIKNMVTGASQAEAAILIVDAKEGIKEQTKRHSYVLSLLGIKQVIVVVNKMDLVGYQVEEYNKIKRELLKFLSNVNIRPRYVIPISAKEGDNIIYKAGNMSWYSGITVLEALDSFIPEKNIEDRPLRFPVQDVYKIDEKRINVGRVESGIIKKGEKIVILPEGKKTRVKSVEKYLQQVTKAKAGESTGIVTEDAFFLDRGMVICHEHNQPRVTNRITANVFWMAKLPFDLSQPITMKLATQEIRCKVERIIQKINSSTLEKIEEDMGCLRELEVGTIVLKTSNLIVVDNFNQVPGLGRFVFELDGNTCAGGIITETGK
ncbi:MAG: GTP-binding protein [Nanoarchaeota archaeon]